MSVRYKLVFNVPLSHAESVRHALGTAGAGKIRDYSYCSFSIRGTGRFLPGENANPHIGERGKLETVEEDQIQVDVLHDDMKPVLEALKAAHPYEEIGYEIYEMVDEGIF